MSSFFRLNTVAGAVFTAVLVSGVSPAWAGGDFRPPPPLPAEPEPPVERKTFGLSGEVNVEFQVDHTYKSQDPDAELTDVYNTTEAALELTINEWLSGVASLTFEPVLDPDPGDDRFFEDEGLYAEELYAQVALGGGVSVRGGKFNPFFGKAWDVAPGVYGTDFAEDYEITEQVGFGVSIERDAGSLGKAIVSGSIYSADTSFLSGSLITNRGTASRSDGGAGNTDGLNSYSVALDLEEMPALGGANLTFGYRFHEQGETVDDLDDENGYVAGIHGSRMMNGVEFQYIGEVVYLDGAEGTLDDLWYYTVGGALVFADKYNVSISYTGRPRDVVGGGDFEDKQFQISAGAEITNGWTLDGAYKYAVEEDIESHTVGLLLAKSFEFDTRNR